MNGNEITRDASVIQKILSKGYYIAQWPNSEGRINYYLVENGKLPHTGAYISAKDNLTK